MPKTILVTISEPFLTILERWSSVNRTLRVAQDACNAAGKESNREKFIHCSSELETLIPALEHMHARVREQLWIEEPEGEPKKLSPEAISLVNNGEISLTNAYYLTRHVRTEDQIGEVLRQATVLEENEFSSYLRKRGA